ncbi:S26 family signal peptidase [Streptomyces sp. H27-C3]|uniref:S26 family signal peptidase n=1 Tax=Streptomyces sp. H27-C3 TaxID=3046305 RepID=UPI0024BAA5FD|nr:S26 family signal peptidase [Streptomyces sp. H27-C3]MDJ0461235.1 S26 family signal peptidase [Streptomyces sp. H27-C3]
MSQDFGPRAPGPPAESRDAGSGSALHAVRKAESALDRARVRSRRALLLRGSLLAAVALLWSGAAALMIAGAAPGWVVFGGCCALLLTLGLVLSRLAERRLVAVTVSGRSMEPAHHEGDQVLVRRRAVPVPGAVVVVERPPFRSPWTEPPVASTAGPHLIYERQWVIKRVAAVPGDRVPRDGVPALADAPGPVVPPGMLVLLGDNEAESYDSRQVGYFPAARVLGAVVRRQGRDAVSSRHG